MSDKPAVTFNRAQAEFLLAIHKEWCELRRQPEMLLAVHLRAALEEIDQLEKRPLRTFDHVAGDRLADEVAVLVRRRVIDARSPAGDALLDYRDPPTTARADRLAEIERAHAALSAEVEAMRPVVEAADDAESCHAEVVKGMLTWPGDLSGPMHRLARALDAYRARKP
ncbi:MAG TPA: hypothetical protein VJU58_13820 [Microbacterium sp.]|nr:hypothetical protein [Microbacterium sp.]